VTGPSPAELDRDAWERRWEHAVAVNPDAVVGKPPNPHLVAAAASLTPGSALDAGAGNGSETLWLAGRGWQVTAVDFSTTALSLARERAEALGPEMAGRVAWVEGDLGSWAPASGRYDLVTSLHVHVAGPVTEFVGRLSSGVAPGGTLLLVGHRPVDPVSGAPTRAAGQQQVSVEESVAALDPGPWAVVVAEERRRPDDGVDAVVVARRR
jgi:SAM-dependent methyltransferase